MVNVRQGTGDRKRETGDGRPETGNRRRETGDRRQETGQRHVLNSFRPKMGKKCPFLTIF